MEGHFEFKAHVESTLKQLRINADEMPSDMVWDLYELMLETARALLQAWNSQKPLLRLPNEILGHIMELIPDFREDTEEDLLPAWRSAARDTLMLFPISQTCHRLRVVSLGNPSLWRHIHSTYRDPGIEELMSRSEPLPLTVVMNRSRPLSLLEDTRLRAQELHTVHLDVMTQVVCLYFKLPWPQLQALSLVNSDDGGWNGDDPFPLSSAPQLRFLHLEHLSIFVSGDAPNLTHLSLSMIHLAKCHAQVATLLSSCPNLVNVTFDRMNNPGTPRVPPIADLPRLKRVTFHDMTTPIIQFYLTVMACPRPGLAVQVLSGGDVPLRRFPIGSLLPFHSRGGPSFLALGGHFDEEYLDLERLVSVTAFSDVNSFRLCRPYDIMQQHLPRIVADQQSVLKLREVWIVDVPVEYRERVATTISSVLASLPALETLTIVRDHSKNFLALPNLRCLPRLSNMPFECRRLKTVRLVHGSSKSRGTRRSSTGVSKRLSLQKVLRQLSSREYQYLDTLTIQTTSHLYVDREELNEIAEYIPTVHCETIDVLPSMTLPDYCVEPASGLKAAFPGAMW